MKKILLFISISLPMLSFCAANKDIERFEKLVIEAKKISAELSKKSSRKFWNYFNKKKKKAKREAKREAKQNELNKTHEKIIDLWDNESCANLDGEDYTSILKKHSYISVIQELNYHKTFPTLSSWQTPLI